MASKWLDGLQGDASGLTQVIRKKKITYSFVLSYFGVHVYINMPDKKTETQHDTFHMEGVGFLS